MPWGGLGPAGGLGFGTTPRAPALFAPFADAFEHGAEESFQQTGKG